VDGRRDSHRVFSREEEEELKEALSQENVHPNKPVVRELALRIHQQHEKESSPGGHTRAQTSSTAPFVAGDSFVQRVKKAIKHSDERVTMRRRYKRPQPADAEERKVANANQYKKDVEQAVETYRAAYTINADEISAKIVSPPRTLWAPVNSPQPAISSNHTEKEAFTHCPVTLQVEHGQHQLSPRTIAVPLASQSRCRPSRPSP
jgi:hypothetical protein